MRFPAHVCLAPGARKNTAPSRRTNFLSIPCLRHHHGAILLPLLLASALQPACADDTPVSLLLPGRPAQFWVNLGGISQHFQYAEEFNQQNFGYGIEYQLSASQYLVLGGYRNSVHADTRYIGGAWMPLAAGSFKLGAIAGLADGYAAMRDGGFFPVVLPVLAFERGRVGANFILIPNMKDKVSGAVAMQLKFRFQ